MKDIDIRYFSKDNRFLLVRNGKKEGVISDDGNIIVPIKYDSIIDFYYEDISQKITYIAARKDGKVDMWFLSSDDQSATMEKTHLAITCDSYESTFDMFFGFLVIKCGNKYGALDKNLNTVIPVVYDELEYEIFCGFKAKLNGKWGFINESGQTIIPHRFDAVEVEWLDGIKVKLNEKWGFIDQYIGEVIALPKYDEIIEYCFEGFVIAKRDGQLFKVEKNLELPIN